MERRKTKQNAICRGCECDLDRGTEAVVIPKPRIGRMTATYLCIPCSVQVGELAAPSSFLIPTSFDLELALEELKPGTIVPTRRIP